MNKSVYRNVIHGYLEDFNCQILTYTMNEIFAEKLRAILENTKKIHERSSTRSRARDYYDHWRILHAFSEQLKAENITQALIKKCEGKGVFFQNIDNFFDQKILDTVERDWDQWLSPLIHPLPSYEKVISELRQELKNFLH